MVTRLWLHREVGLPLQDGVDELGVVPEHRIISICGCHLGHCGACWRGEGGGITQSELAQAAVPVDGEIK